MLANLSSAKNTCNRHCAQVAVGYETLSLYLSSEMSHLMSCEKSDSLHLMEHGVVTGVNLVPTIYITSNQEGIQTRVDKLMLMGRGVRS